MRRAFADACSNSMKFKVMVSVPVISMYAGAAAAIGASPIPFTDAALLVPLQLSMLLALAKVWHIRPTNATFLRTGLLQIALSQGVSLGAGSLVCVWQCYIHPYLCI